VSFRSPGAVCDLSRKFGCDPEDALSLAGSPQAWHRRAGFSFHVGSQAGDAAKHVEAIEAARGCWPRRGASASAPATRSISAADFRSTTAQRAVGIRSFCAPIRRALARLPGRVRVIAEPGRFIVGPAAIGVATVMGRAQREGHWWYYLDDGLYGSYSGQLYDHARYPVAVMRDGPLLPFGARRSHLRWHRRDRRERCNCRS
jgi:ornithine decarboxylase